MLFRIHNDDLTGCHFLCNVSYEPVTSSKRDFLPATEPAAVVSKARSGNINSNSKPLNTTLNYAILTTNGGCVTPVQHKSLNEQIQDG